MVNAWLAAGSINGVEICKNRCYERRMTTQQPFSKNTTPAVQSALKTFAIERAGIMAIEAAFGDEALSELARCFSEVVARFAVLKGRVVVTGMGKSGHVGRKLAATFASTGTPAFFVHPAEASHGDMGMIQEGDAILALSWSGETAELADIITFSRRFNILLVAFTSNMAGTLAREADIALILPKSEEACPNGLAPTTSTTMQLVLGDALAVALLETRGFTAHDFKMFHPGGKLGARLLHVRDVMHAGDDIPLVLLGTSMAGAVVVMTQKRLGCILVVDEHGSLCGIITDGDLRRNVERNNILALPVDDLMQALPLQISPDDLAAEALEMLNRRKVSVLAVTANGKPTGIVHIHDLLRLGVA